MRKKVMSVLLMISILFTCGFGKSAIDTEYLEIKQYKDLDIEIVEKEEVTDALIDQQIDSMLSANTSKSTIDDRSAENGDWVVIDFTGLVDGVAQDGMTAADTPLELGSGTFIPGFEDNIVGHGSGEQFEFDLAFPDPYAGNPDLSGVTAHWIITIKEIYTLEKSEFTDAFVKDVLAIDGVDTVDQYREYLRDLMQRQVDYNSENQQKQLVWAAIDEQSQIKKYDEAEVQKLVDDTFVQYETEAALASLDVDEYLKQAYGVDAETLKVQLTENSKMVIRQKMIFEAIGEKENLLIDDEYFNANSKAFAEKYGFSDVDEMIGIYTEEDVKYAMLQDRVLDFVLENSAQLSDHNVLNKMIYGFPLWGILAAAAIGVLLIITIIGTSVSKKRKAAIDKKRKQREEDDAKVSEMVGERPDEEEVRREAEAVEKLDSVVKAKEDEAIKLASEVKAEDFDDVNDSAKEESADENIKEDSDAE